MHLLNMYEKYQLKIVHFSVVYMAFPTFLVVGFQAKFALNTPNTFCAIRLAQQRSREPTFWRERRPNSETDSLVIVVAFLYMQ